MSTLQHCLLLQHQHQMLINGVIHYLKVVNGVLSNYFGITEAMFFSILSCRYL